MQDIFIGVDCGGTNLRVTCSDRMGGIINETSVPTHSQAETIKLSEKIICVIEDTLKKLGQMSDGVRCIGIGVPGVCFENSVHFCPNIEGFDIGRVKKYFEEKYKLSVVFQNDVKCAALGEKWLGASREYSNSVYVNIGTGLSAGIIINGTLYSGDNNASGEIAYFPVEPDDIKGCRSGRAPLEEMFSGRGIEEGYLEFVNKSSLFSDSKGNKTSGGLNSKMLFKQYFSGNKEVKEFLDKRIQYFSFAIACISILLNPGIIVLGGGVSRDMDYFIEKIHDYLCEMVPYPPVLTMSSLENNAGILGAVRLAMLAYDGMSENKKQS